jgi:DNA polymerase
MRVVRLASEIDFDGWRKAARALRAEGVAPEAVVWTVEFDLFESAVIPAEAQRRAGTAARASGGPGSPLRVVRDDMDRGGEKPFTVPKPFIDLAEQVVLHRSSERFALLYKLLCRLEREPSLIDNPADPDMTRARDMAKGVSRAAHKMKAFVRFRLVEGVEPEAYMAWFEPAHRVTEAVAPFFARRFTGMTWTILTPDACVAWDGENLKVSEGADPADAPREDAQEELWRTYYASIFNPARLNPRMMQQEMPKRYWRNLPEARLIPELIESAQRRTAEMVAARPNPPSDRVLKAALRHARDGSYGESDPLTLEEAAAAEQVCRRCDLWRDATQAVPGEGPARARIMIVGEQPGDEEDLTRRPFVGPAGRLLDKAMLEADFDRRKAFVTNAVKHFKHEPRGKFRLHKTPDRGEVQACRWWLDAERRMVKPKVILALGATAVMGVTGRSMPIAKSRGAPIALDGGAQLVVSWHPSYLLRVPDADAKARAYTQLVEDLRLAKALI